MNPNPKTLSMLGLLALLAFAPAASAENTDASLADLTGAVGGATAAESSTSATTLCYAIRLDDSVAVASGPHIVTAFDADSRLVAFRLVCPGPGVLIPAGCTLTYALALVGSTGPVVAFVLQPIGAWSIPGAIAAGGATGGQAAGATLTYVGCI